MPTEPWSDAHTHTCSGASSWTEVHTLLPASTYHLTLVAVNSVGESAPTTPPLVVHTAEEVPEGPPTHVRGMEQGSQTIVVTWQVRQTVPTFPTSSSEDFAPTLRSKSAYL